MADSSDGQRPYYQRLETLYEPHPICPFCAHIMRDAWELNLSDEETTTVTCDRCEQRYHVCMSIEYRYTTTRPSESDDD